MWRLYERYELDIVNNNHVISNNKANYVQVMITFIKHYKCIQFLDVDKKYPSKRGKMHSDVRMQCT